MNARKSILVTGFQIIIAILGWVGLVILAKYWGGYAPEALGVIGYALAFVGLFGALADVGFSQAHVKRVSEGKDLGRCIGTFTLIKSLLIILMVFVVLIVLFITRNFLGMELSDTTDFVILAFVIYYVFGFLIQIPTATFQGLGEMAKREITAITESLVRVLLRVLIVLAGVAVVGKVVIEAPIVWPSFLKPIQEAISYHPVDSLAVAFVIGSVFTFVVGIWFLRKYPVKKPTKEMMKSYFIFAIPISLVSVSTLITKSVDKVMIGYFWSAIEVGYYFTVQQIAQVIIILSSSVAVVLFPSLSKSHSLNNYKAIEKTVFQSVRYISMVVVPIIVVIIIFSKEIIIVMLDTAFIPGSNTLVILSLFALVTGLMVPYTCLITGIDKPKIVAKIGVLMCISNVILNLLFIPDSGLLSLFKIYGSTGAAVASFLSVFIGFLYSVLVVKKLTNVKVFNLHTPIHITAGAITGGIIYYVGSFVSTMYWYHLIMISFICVLVYGGLLIALKEFNRNDLNFFLETLSVRKMLVYVKEEVRGKK